MASDVRTPHDLEDRRPLANLAVNVLQNARGARAPHIDGTAKLSNKRLRGPRSTDAQKLESMFITIDRIDAIFSLAEDLRQYLLSTCSNLNCSRSSLQLAIDALAFMGSESKVQMVRLRSVTNNTSAKKEASQAHSKLTKIERWRAKNDQMQRRAFASSNPKKMLQVSIKNVKDKLETTAKVPSVSPDLPSAGALAPRPKRQKLASPGVVVLSRDDKRDQVYS